MELQGKTVLLTGASGGIGGALAQTLDKAGCRLLLSGRNQAKLDALLNQLQGQEHRSLAVDLTSKQGRALLLAEATRQDTDILVNCFGVNQLSLLKGMADDAIETIVNTNLTVPMQLCRGMLPVLASRPESAIVNIGSTLGSIGYAGSAVYCASKFGLRGFTEALRRELADTATRVIYIAPRATHTELNSEEVRQMNRKLGNAVDPPERVAESLLKALRQDGADNHYLGLPEAFFVRLNSLFPGLVDRALFKQLPVIRRFAESAKP